MFANDAVEDRLPVLDGLRGLAIVLVVATHSFLTGYRPALNVGPVAVGFEPLVLAGSLGVELFFYLSGFVLFLPYAQATLGWRAPPTLAHFIDRRVIKIVPSYYLALLVTAALFYLPPDEAARRSLEIFRHLAFVHPFWYESMFAIQSPFWSVGIEVQFYFLFPLIAAAMRRKPASTCMLLLLIGEGFRLWLRAAGLSQNFYYVSQLPAQIDLFGLGMFSAYLFTRLDRPARRPRVEIGAGIVAALALVAFVWLLNDLSHMTKVGSAGDHQAWQCDHRLIVGATLTFFTLGSLLAAPMWRRAVANPLLMWLATISYNLYLWHGAIVVQCTHTGFPCAGIATPWLSDPNWGSDFFWSYLLVSLALATLVTYTFERPLLRLGTRGVFERVTRCIKTSGDDGNTRTARPASPTASRPRETRTSGG